LRVKTTGNFPEISLPSIKKHKAHQFFLKTKVSKQLGVAVVSISFQRVVCVVIIIIFILYGYTWTGASQGQHIDKQDTTINAHSLSQAQFRITNQSNMLSCIFLDGERKPDCQREPLLALGKHANSRQKGHSRPGDPPAVSRLTPAATD